MGDFLYRYNSEALSQFTCPPSAKLDIATQKLSVDYGASGRRDAPHVSVGIAETIRMQADCRLEENTGRPQMQTGEHRGEQMQRDRGAAIGGGCRVVCTLCKQRSSRTLIAALKTTIQPRLAECRACQFYLQNLEPLKSKKCDDRSGMLKERRWFEETGQS
jgi:hypothetical protein